MRRLGAATVALIATGCSILIDSSKYTGGDAGPDAASDAAADAPDAGGCSADVMCPMARPHCVEEGRCVECITDDHCDVLSELCEENVCMARCFPSCTNGMTYCVLDASMALCLPCDGDMDGFGPRPLACPGLPPARDCDDTDPDIHPGALITCNNGVADDCASFPLSVPGFDEVGGIRPQQISTFMSLPVQLSLSARGHRFGPDDEPWAGIAVIQDGSNMPRVAGFDIEPDMLGRLRTPETRDLQELIVSSVIPWVATRVEDVFDPTTGRTETNFLLLGPPEDAVELFSGLLMGPRMMTRDDRLRASAAAMVPVGAPAGTIAFLALRTEAAVSAVWRNPGADVLQRLRAGPMLLDSATVDSDLGLRWMASDGSLVMASTAPPLTKVVFWRGESGKRGLRTVDLPPGLELLSADAGVSSGALMQLDDDGYIYLALVPTADNALLAWYIPCGDETAVSCPEEPMAVADLGAVPGETIERVAGERLIEIVLPLTAAQVLVATTVNRITGSDGVVLTRLEVLPGMVTHAQAVDLSIEVDGIDQLPALATALRQLESAPGIPIGTDFIVAAAVMSGSRREVWMTGARFCFDQ
jgi:hypothetical protein